MTYSTKFSLWFLSSVCIGAGYHMGTGDTAGALSLAARALCGFVITYTALLLIDRGVRKLWLRLALLRETKRLA